MWIPAPQSLHLPYQQKVKRFSGLFVGQQGPGYSYGHDRIVCKGTAGAHKRKILCFDTFMLISGTHYVPHDGAVHVFPSVCFCFKYIRLAAKGKRYLLSAKHLFLQKERKPIKRAVQKPFRML